MCPGSRRPWPRRRRKVSGRAGARGPRDERPRSLVLTGGGTGGHLYPAISIARALAETGGAEPLFIGSRAGFETELVPREGFALPAVTSRNMSCALLRSVVLSVVSIAWGRSVAWVLLTPLALL